jgi:uncharacterized protein (TIGR00106 family)
MSSWNQLVIADLCVLPIGLPTVGMHKEIAQVSQILQRFPIETKLHAYGTNIHGEWDDVFAAVKQVHAELHDSGVVRVSSNMRFGTRTDKSQTLEEKVSVVEALLGEKQHNQ